jgi:3-hydroxyacyl-CoA dehydrogenase / enoyl-CoA hydratase / 3-hydroxybutyryl-CoA epimerase / enoyl-CoA isomerase
MFQGRSIHVERLPEGLAELRFDRRDESVNKFDVATVEELQAATAVLRAAEGVNGVLVTSAKSAFIVGADIFEFAALFAQDAAEIAAFNRAQSAVFTAFEDLPMPIVTAINGLALGGGFEMALAADYRVIADGAQVGLPEVSLGLFPGFGGTVRLPRLIGAAAALEWIITGKPQSAAAAAAVGAVDGIAPPALLRDMAMAKLRQSIANDAWKGQRAARNGRVRLFDAEAVAALAAGCGKSSRHYPAALAAVQLVQSVAALSRDEALLRESEGFGRIARTPTAAALVQLFVNDQALKKKSREYAKIARKVERAAVLGAGIMGGGIAYTSASRGIPVVMKDIAPAALDLGKREANKLLDKQVAAGRLNTDKARTIDASIVATLDYNGFGNVDVVVEAVVEDLKIKKTVLGDVEKVVAPGTVLASNTSSLSIGELGSALSRPENFVGMHFFNPVPVMPLVEVIRGSKTSDVAAATIAGFATAMGKTPVVVQDCPGFLVNRILTASFIGFVKLIRDGADFEQVDRAMEAFGWPMGPAYLQDVIGMDTSSHVIEFITAGYPQRMRLDFEDVIHMMAGHKRYGQKSGVGFYRYEADPKGRPLKRSSPDTAQLIASVQPQGQKSFAEEEMVERLMLPMIVEAAICLEEGIADSAAEIDMSMVLGVGFPRHWGGPLLYADLVGLDRVIERCGRYAALGGGYVPTQRMGAMARSRERFHGPRLRAQ